MINHSIIFRNCFLRDSINADWPSLWTEERNSYPARFHGEPTVSWCCPPTSTTPLSCKWTLAPGANQHCGLIGTRWTRRQMIGRPVRWPSVSKEHSNWGKPGMPEIQEHDKDSEKTGKTYLVCIYSFLLDVLKSGDIARLIEFQALGFVTHEALNWPEQVITLGVGDHLAIVVDENPSRL